MARITSVATVLPEHVVTQDQVLAVMQRVYSGNHEVMRLLPMLKRSGVRRRHFSFCPDYYLSGKSFEQRNADYVAKGMELAVQAAQCCIRKASVRADQVDHVFLVTTTGLATPSLDALLANRIGLRADVRRSPLFGLGCAGGAGALVRAAEYVNGSPGRRALVVSVELSGQIFSLQAQRAVDIVGTALFGDGCAAVLLEADDVAGDGPVAIGSKSVLFPETEHVMGWAFTSRGMQLKLSQDVAALVQGSFKNAVEQFAEECRVEFEEIKYWLLHPGGRKVIDSYSDAFDLTEEDLRWSRSSLAEIGNVSSASVLFVLNDFTSSGLARSGQVALLGALGPGFAAELMLLRW